MWPDNETDIDLLGFDFLVDELLVLLRDPNVLPVTIGIAGDWGSGKSSILKMAGKALAEEGAGKFAVVEFSPWRFEDYEDVKAALLEAVLGAVKGNVSAVTDEARKAKLAKLLKRLVLRVKWLPAMRMAAAAALKGHTDLTPEQIGLLSNPLITAGLEAKQQEALAKLEAEGKAPEEPVTLGEFRETFAELMTDLDVQALVVLVDDLDRCLPNTIIDVFEAMRLFLHAPKTAFVVAADQRMVEAAVKHAYPDAVAADTSVATDYLEKILQVTISVPPLSAAESETYASLLMAQANTSPEQFNQLARAAKAERAKASLSVAMNHGIAEAALDTMPDGLADALAIAGRILPVLAPKQRGNPRQIKRFLNLFELRRGAASRREVDLDPAVLAKLMVLEAIASAAYHKLFLWQAQSAGKPPELERAEASVGDPSVELALEVKEWLELAGVADWVPSSRRSGTSISVPTSSIRAIASRRLCPPRGSRPSSKRSSRNCALRTRRRVRVLSLGRSPSIRSTSTPSTHRSSRWRVAPRQRRSCAAATRSPPPLPPRSRPSRRCSWGCRRPPLQRACQWP